MSVQSGNGNENNGSSSSSSTLTEFVKNANHCIRDEDFRPPTDGQLAERSAAVLPSSGMETPSASSGRAGHNTTSVGSGYTAHEASRTFTSAERAHMDGTCQPCVLFASAGGCHKGEACRYCHLPHLPEARATTRGVRKHTRDSIKERVLALLRPPMDRDGVHERLQEEAGRHPFGRKLIIKFLDDPPEEHRGL